MGYTTIRVSDDLRNVLRRVSKAERRSMQAVVESALESYRRQRFLARLNEGFAALRRDRAAWSDLVRERDAWDVVLADGLPVESTSRRPGKKRK